MNCPLNRVVSLQMFDNSIICLKSLAIFDKANPRRKATMFNSHKNEATENTLKF